MINFKYIVFSSWNIVAKIIANYIFTNMTNRLTNRFHMSRNFLLAESARMKVKIYLRIYIIDILGMRNFFKIAL